MRKMAYLVLVFFMVTGFMVTFGAEAASAEAVTTAAEASGNVPKLDWFAEFMKGGNTMIALIILVIAMTAFTIERFARLRLKNIAPTGFSDEVQTLFKEKKFDEVLSTCEAKPSTLAEVAHFLTMHRSNDYNTISEAASDIASREVRLQLQKISPLSVIAAVAPLLGLLGTVVGMVEAFFLINVAGDAADASMLAGSISKALVTTAFGLIIAIPAVGLYHYFKHRLLNYCHTLEEEIDKLTAAWFLRKND